MKKGNLRVYGPLLVAFIGGIFAVRTGVHVLFSCIYGFIIVVMVLNEILRFVPKRLVTGQSMSGFRRLILDFIPVLLIAPVYYFTALGSFRVREWHMDAFIREVSPRIDEYKQRTGAYPRSLSEVTDKWQPYDFRGGNGYKADGETYWFEYPSAEGVFLSRDVMHRWSAHANGWTSRRSD